jgi:hypothetical protein
MKKLYIATNKALAIVHQHDGEWVVDLATLRQLHSAPTWSFPPRPYTHHVRWMTPDPL